MPLPLVPVVAAMAAPLFWLVRKREKIRGLTPERKKILDSALTHLKDPEKLSVLGHAYKNAGLKKEGELLHKRARLRSLPKDQQKARRQVFREALKSRDKNYVNHVANAFLHEGATGAAATLRTYASGLE